MPTAGAAASTSAMTAVATSIRLLAARAGSLLVIVVANVLPLPSEQSRWAEHQHDHHDDEDHRVGRLGVEVLRQALDDAEAEAGEDRSHDRAHAADDDDGEHDDDEIGAHQRIDLVD